MKMLGKSIRSRVPQMDNERREKKEKEIQGPLKYVTFF